MDWEQCQFICSGDKCALLSTSGADDRPVRGSLAAEHQLARFRTGDSNRQTPFLIKQFVSVKIYMFYLKPPYKINVTKHWYGFTFISSLLACVSTVIAWVSWSFAPIAS